MSSTGSLLEAHGSGPDERETNLKLVYEQDPDLWTAEAMDHWNHWSMSRDAMEISEAGALKDHSSSVKFGMTSWDS